ncbi:Transcriptional regulator of nonfermentable carbon utilization [Rhodotorula kratochvilovae]
MATTAYSPAHPSGSPSSSAPAGPSPPSAAPASSSSSTTAAFFPSLVAAASINAFSSSGPSPPTGASASPDGGAGAFFTSNRTHYGPSAAAPARSTAAQTFLPPLQPAPPAPVRTVSGSSAGRGGATLLSDEESASEGGAGSGGGGTPGSSTVAALGGFQPIAPAPSAGGRKPRAASVASSSGGGGGGGASSKAKGKARADGDGGTPAKGKKAGGGGKQGKRGQQVGPDGKPLPKKKKAGRACAACQKAHLTCDDARPCARCIKKGCPDECVDGARKKAKYLQEIPDERTSLDNSMPDMGAPEPALASATLAEPQSQPFFDFSTSLASPTPGITASSAQPAPYDPASFLSFPSTALGAPAPVSAAPTFTAPAAQDATQFGSEAAGFEYAILNAMLNGNGFAIDTHPTPALGGGGVGGFSGAQQAGADDPMLLDGAGAGDAGVAQELQQQRGAFSASPQPGGLMTAEEAYRSVTRPYPYAQSYHFLVKHLKERFEKNDILRIIRALATFRPSLIALQMPLTEEDETFVERTFQRTLVELNKLISFSGTPTVVWRRTGEICLVGTEFCLLTGWKREELVGKKYIFELFDTASVVEYYESFAKHAFESTATSITMQCVVLAPDGRPVPCAFCFSVRRDLFSCPFLVIGSFLPVLV